jgi:DNA segregation ATPase FtsK/SpoIIIE, S-DNA-T family
MKVRLTVCGNGGRLEDVEVDGPTGTMWREVLAELHAVGWSGELAYLAGPPFPDRCDRTVREGALRPIPLDAIVGMPPLISAAVVALTARRCPPSRRPHRPAAAAAEERLDDQTRLRVVGGPDAGGEYTLRGDGVVVGRGIAADIRVEDADMSRMHMRIDRLAAACEQVGGHTSLPVPGSDFRAAHASAGAHPSPLGFRRAAASPASAHLVQQDLGPNRRAPVVWPTSASLVPEDLAADSREASGSAGAHALPGHIGRTPAASPARPRLVRRELGPNDRQTPVFQTSGRLVLHDLGSTNGTSSDGQPVGCEGAALTRGAVVRAGESTLVVVSDAPSGYVVAPDHKGRVSVHIPPRLLTAKIDRQVTFPTKPDGPPTNPLSWISALVPAAIVLPMAVVAGGRMLGLALAAPLSAIAILAVDRSRARRAAMRKRRGYLELEGRARAELRTALADEAHDRRRRAPDMATLLAAARDVTAPLWERRRSDDDFGTVRLGTADLPARTSVNITGSSGPPHDRSPPRSIDRHGSRPDAELLVACVPLTVSLPAVAMLGVAGPRAAALGLVRSAIVQLAVLHRPSDLRIAVLAADHLAADWAWARWLPHIAHGSGALVGSSPPGRAAVVAAFEDRDRQAGPVAQRPPTHLPILEPVQRLREASEDRTGGHSAAKVVRSAWRLAGLSRATVVVIDHGGDPQVEQDLAQVLRRTKPSSTWVVSLTSTRAALPADCGAVVEFGVSGTRLAVVSEGGGLPIQNVIADLVAEHRAAACARALAPLRDQPDDALIGVGDRDEVNGGQSSPPHGNRLPDAVRLLDLLGAEVLDESEAARRWTNARPGAERIATVGVHASGHYRIDLGRDGPHMLVAGTTGAGKSEFLRTLVASIATSAPPHLVTFMLVDYKGGAAFADCLGLPHVAGVLTDLDSASTGRALASLEAELRRRERLFRAAEAKDLDTYRARREAGGPELPSVASLLIVVDEFATLVDELPDFVTGLVSVARRGRSLGIHLVLATQRPAGIVTAEIRANLGLRVCLRVADPADSADVLGSTDAALIPANRPGRALARTGSGRPVEFQSALVSVGVRRQLVRPRRSVAVRTVDWEPGSAPSDADRIDTGPAEQSDLLKLTGTLRAAMQLLGIETVPRPWLPPLREVVTVDELSLEPRACRLPVALLDLPEEQRQSNLVIDLAAGEHWLAVGAPGSGKTTLLRTIAGQLAARLAATEAHLYLLDSSAEALAPLARLPHCGAALAPSESRAVDRLLSKLATEVQRRRRFFASRGIASAAEHNVGGHGGLSGDGDHGFATEATATTGPAAHDALGYAPHTARGRSPRKALSRPPSGALGRRPHEALSRTLHGSDQRGSGSSQFRPAAPVPWMLLLLDDWSSFSEACDRVSGRPLSTLRRLLRDGPSAGLTVVVTGDHGLLTTRIASLIQNRIVLRLADPADAALAGLRPGAIGPSAGDPGASRHRMPAGRGTLAPTGHAVQIALLGSDPGGSAQTAALDQIAEAAAAGQSRMSPPAGLVRVVPLPGRVLHDWKAGPPLDAESASPPKDETPTSINATPTPPGSTPQGTWLLLGAGGDLAEPLGIDLWHHGRLLFIGGPSGSGRTTSIRSIGAWADGHGLTVLDIDDDGEADLIAATGTNRGSLMVVADDAERLLGRPAEEALCQLLAQPPPWFRGAAIAGSADAFGASFSPLAAAVRRRSAVLLLGPPSRADLELVGRRIDRDDDPPPGRGVLVMGSREVDIQLAVCETP